MIRENKYGIRIAAIVSAPISLASKHTLVVCPIMRSSILEGMLSSYVTANGADSTMKIVSMLKRSRFLSQVRLAAFNGIAIAGLNVIDVYKLHEELGIDFAIITRKKPRKQLLIEALEKYAYANGDDVGERIKVVQRISGETIYRLNGFYVQSSIKLNSMLLDVSVSALRLAHIVARAISTGESKGRL